MFDLIAESSSPNLLHKFLMDKLNDASAYGKHIIWENKQEGVFKVLRTDVITEEWDKVKNHRKTDMTWDKLSRAIRYIMGELSHRVPPF